MYKGIDLDHLLEKSLKEMPIVDYATLKSLLSTYGYKCINDKIKYMKKKRLLTSLKKGLYLYNSPYINNTLVSKEIIANNLLGPSYLSFEYALDYHGLIPERVDEVTSATTKRSKRFSTPLGIFSYRHISKELFSFGVEIVTASQGNFMMASREKALCDTLFATHRIKITSVKMMRLFLEDDLRVDMDELNDFSLEIIEKYIKITKSKRVELFYKVLQGMDR